MVGSQQCVRLASAELGLQAVNASGSHVTRQPGRQLTEERQKVPCQVGLLAERDWVEVIGRTPVAIHQTQIGSKQRLVK